MGLVNIVKDAVNCVRRWSSIALYYEEAYQQALVEELRSHGVHCSTELMIPVHYNGTQLSNVHIRPDIVASKGEEKVIIELKRVTRLNENHRRQLHGYMKQMNVGIGILVNFPDGFEVLVD